jgi:hypothetical protein
MKIETSKVTKIRITDLIDSEFKLDPITVILEDLGPSKGKILIECYGQSWAAYWRLTKMTISRSFTVLLFLACAVLLADCVPDDNGGDSYDITRDIAPMAHGLL